MNKIVKSPERVTALLILVVAIAIAGVASTYPINESWGGVASAWYVSPALLPLFISACLFLLAVTLFLKPSNKVWQDYFSGAGSQKFWVISALISFVYILIPNVDFYLSSVLFLSVLVGRFHLTDSCVSKPLSRIYILVCGLVLMALLLEYLFQLFAQSSVQPSASGVAFSMETNMAISAAYITDLVGVLGAAACIWVLHVHKAKVFWVCVWLPLILVIGFRFLLLVPMPTEGSVILVLNEIFNLTLSLLSSGGA